MFLILLQCETLAYFYLWQYDSKFLLQGDMLLGFYCFLAWWYVA